MDKNKSQRYNFAQESIPTLFHTQTSEFLKYFERDGLKFLKFWWDHLGEQLPKNQLSEFEGFEYEVFDLKPATHVIILVFPQPMENGEVYFQGLISRPERRFVWVKLPTTKIIGLVRRGEGVELGYHTPRALFVPIPEDVAADRAAFTEAILRIAEGKG